MAGPISSRGSTRSAARSSTAAFGMPYTIELARSYSGDEAVAFVNGVLDAVRRELGRE